MSWNALKIKALLEELRRYGGDTTDVEMKLGQGGVPSLGESFSAFGNMPDGGVIVVGVEEPGFVVRGVKEPAEMIQGIGSQARATSLNPPVTTQFDVIEVDGKDLVICEVAGLPLPDRPCLFEGVAYLRQADGDYRMSDVELQMVEDRKRQAALGGAGWLSPDSQSVPGTSLADLDDEIVDTVLTNFRASSRRNRELSDDDLLYNLGILGSSGAITVAGIYVLGKFPQRFVPSWGAVAAVQLEGKGGGRTRDLQHLEGPVPEMFSQLMEWADRNVVKDVVYRADGNAVDVSNLPAAAMRELFANALVHRDLSTLSRGASVNARLKRHQLVVTNPGGLVGITTDQLGDQNAQRPVNEHVYRLCQHYRFNDGSRLIEGEGGGIKWVRRELNAADLQPPRFYDKGVSFTAIISEESLLEAEDLAWLTEVDPEGTLTRVQRNIVVAMRHGKQWSNSEVRDAFGVDLVEARLDLQTLVSRGLAETDGAGRSTIYHLAEHTEETKAAKTISVPETPTRDRSVEVDETHNADGLLSALVPGESLTVREFRRATGLSERQVRYALDRLEDSGRLCRSPGRPARWKLSSTTE